MRRIIVSIIFTGMFLLFTHCDKTGSVNFFSINDDLEFGRKLDSTIYNTPSEFTVASRTQYQDAYNYLYSMMNEIISSDHILYRNKLVWKITIIDDDETFNAFAAPGGYLYFYTGLMKYLDYDSHLAGVMAHEIAHADRRHSTSTMTKVYGFSVLINIVLGNDQALLEQIIADLALGLGGLKFSREHEYEADEYAVKYTSTTKYHPKGIAGFFEKLESEDSGLSKPPEFLSTHPSPNNRLEEIDRHWISLGSPVGQNNSVEYNNFKASLP